MKAAFSPNFLPPKNVPQPPDKALTPVPATKPRSSAFISVTGTPEGLSRPVAQPARNRAGAATLARARRRRELFMVLVLNK